MRIESVTAHAFGPLANQTMEFAEGLTVVYGPNESAKSSWHAATYAALCGRHVPQSSFDKRFVERHKPWDRPGWLVEARLLLDDGRRVRLRQDLLNNADRQATDLAVGRDCSAEIINGQFLDAAMWLGLDRDSLRCTACIGQTQVLQVIDGVPDLQRFLQAAIATGAARPVDAIKRLEDFRASAVGGPRARSSPKRIATEGYDAAAARLQRARDQHAEYEKCLARLDAATDERREAGRLLAQAAWASAATAADELRQRLAEAEQLSAARLGESGVDPVRSGGSGFDPECSGESGVAPKRFDDDSIAAEVGAALLRWRQAHPAEVAARPASPGADQAAGRCNDQSAQLWRLVSELEVAVPAADPRLAGCVTSLRAQWDTSRRAQRRDRVVAVAGAGAAVAAAVLAVFGPSVLRWGSVGVVVLGALSTAYAIASGVAAVRRGQGPEQVRVRLDLAEQEAEREAGAIAAAQATHARAYQRCVELGVPAQPDLLRRRLLDQTVAASLDQDRSSWEQSGAAAAVRDVAARLGLVSDDDWDAAAQLTEWQKQRAAALDRERDVREAERRLATVLGGATLPELRRLVQAAQTNANRRLTDFESAESEMAARAGVSGAPAVVPPAGLPAALPGGLPAEEVGQRVRAAELAVREAELAAQAAVPVVSVAEAEEQFVAAQAQRDRVASLESTLERTIDFLTKAQELAHRTIAPRLNDSVRAMLPVVTDGRYTEVAIDTANLNVTVWGRGGAPRSAAVLSHGTAEQIYLLLRVALTEYLVRDGVSAPLLLDDVTVHADRSRADALMGTLLAVATRHQVIVFTQQEQVWRWAIEHANSGRHAVRELPPLPSIVSLGT